MQVARGMFDGEAVVLARTELMIVAVLNFQSPPVFAYPNRPSVWSRK